MTFTYYCQGATDARLNVVNVLGRARRADNLQQASSVSRFVLTRRFRLTTIGREAPAGSDELVMDIDGGDFSSAIWRRRVTITWTAEIAC
ncbi:hypothetical protein EVAR_85289_1 [Eumeta japonica]|uniref:Uncharacterized protein n=1 Tax=Eumeta variegata TaxID=151549 RepID=A0A4C1V7C1_EUMVA|nr:hypothetical protein EVAR_85289_1 [Eumeta japonica]